jgi:hypothetical protein
MSTKFNLPTETVELPSKGLLYPKDSPLSSGTIEMKYMTAKEEDILTNQNYIRQGTVIDKLLQSLIVTEGVNYSDILVGDKNAIMVAARILSYGKDYEIEYRGEKITVDLSELDNKVLDESLYKAGENNFTYELPYTKNTVTFKLLSQKDEQVIEKEIKGLKKIDKNSSTEVTSRLKHIITSVNGSTEQKDIREFVDKYLLAKDARALREYYAQVNPDIDLSFAYNDNGVEEDVDLPIGLNFFWPDI